MMQIKLQYCRAASIILIFSPFKATHDTQMTFKCTTFSSVFCFEEKISMRAFSCLLQVHILWIVTQISVWSKSLKHQNFTSSWCSEHFPFPHEEPPRWWQGGEGDRAGTAVTAPWDNHFHFDYRCHCKTRSWWHTWPSIRLCCGFSFPPAFTTHEYYHNRDPEFIFLP